MADDPTPARFKSALAERLLSRATGAVGVIDVGGSQARYERAMAWPRQHVSLLDRWTGRYVTEAPQDQSAGQVFAARQMSAFAPAIDVAPTERPRGPARAPQRSEPPVVPVAAAHRREAGDQDAGHRPEVHHGPAMRAAPLARSRSPLAARSASPVADLPGAVADKASASGSDARSDLDRREVVVASEISEASAFEPTPLRGSPPRDAREGAAPVARATSSVAPVPVPPVRSIDVAPSGFSAREGSPGALVPSEVSPGGAASDRASHHPTTEPAPYVTRHATRVVASEIARPAVTPSGVFVQRRLAESEVGPAGAAIVPAAIDLTVARSRAPFATSVPAPAATSVSVGTTAAMELAGSTAGRSSPGDKGEPIPGADQTQGARWQATLPAADVARSPATAQPLLGARQSASAQTALAHPVTAIAPRVRTADASSSEFVWRASAEPGRAGAVADKSSPLSGLPSPSGRSRAPAFLTAPPTTMGRAFAADADGESSSPAGVGAEHANGSGGRGPDAAQLMEQVTRRLLRQIAVERERRGGSRWP